MCKALAAAGVEVGAVDEAAVTAAIAAGPKEEAKAAAIEADLKQADHLLQGGD